VDCNGRMLSRPKARRPAFQARPGESSGIVSFRRPGSSPQEVLRELNAARVVGRAHADFVRLSPHFYNTLEEVDHVLQLLAPGGVNAA
jgi:selenocysteine lyase/cysteine desulfurase